MKNLIFIAAIAASAMAQAVTMATKGYVNTQVNALSNNLNTVAQTDPDYYKNSMWYLGTGTEGNTVVLNDHTVTHITLANASSKTTVQLPAPVIVNGKNRSRSMILTVTCTAATVPTFSWATKDAAGNTITFFGRDTDAGTPIVGTKAIMISEIKQNAFCLDYAELSEIFKE